MTALFSHAPSKVSLYQFHFRSPGFLYHMTSIYYRFRCLRPIGWISRNIRKYLHLASLTVEQILTYTKIYFSDKYVYHIRLVIPPATQNNTKVFHVNREQRIVYLQQSTMWNLCVIIGSKDESSSRLVFYQKQKDSGILSIVPSSSIVSTWSTIVPLCGKGSR